MTNKPHARPLCPYCGNKSKLFHGDVLYFGRRDLHDKLFYVCVPCDAYVGCHAGTTKPLGRLANKALRKAKQQAHAVFDPMWQTKMQRESLRKKDARGAAYKWLADQMGIERQQCHIGMFDEAQCQKVIEICVPFYKEKAA